jgi:Na+-transporting NADH:ubiquinone oxidoreductase subunit C
VYVVKKSETDATPRMYIFPIRGKGLWSTLRGFFAIDTDIKTVRGITYYEHAETPGLGGEVDNPEWKRKWPGKIAFDDAGKVIIRVTKNVSTNSDIDALSGSTITSNGVTNMLRFWLGPDGFGPYLSRIQPGSSTHSVINQK